MKYYKFFSVLVTSLMVAQADINPTAALKNLTPPNAPAFVLMDIAPSNIIIPDHIQAFSLQTISAFTGDSSSGLSNNNYAVEFQPYWYVKREKINFFKYNNLRTGQPEGQNRSADDYSRYNVFGDAWKKASVSLALMNGTFDVFDVPQSYVSIGARTRLISVRTSSQIDDIKSQYKAYEHFMSSPEVVFLIANPQLSLSEINTAITNLEGYKTITKNFEQTLHRKPFFALDVAAAYSHFLGDKSQDMEDAFGRLAIWASGDLAFYTPSLAKKSHIRVSSVFRYLRDGLNINPDSGDLWIETAIDYGGKITWEWKSVSVGYEYINRDSDNNNEERSIGSVRYKINNAFTINCGLGKNFKSKGRALVLFGLQWGFNFDNTVELDPKW